MRGGIFDITMSTVVAAGLSVASTRAQEVKDFDLVIGGQRFNFPAIFAKGHESLNNQNGLYFVLRLQDDMTLLPAQEGVASSKPKIVVIIMRADPSRSTEDMRDRLINAGRRYQETVVQTEAFTIYPGIASDIFVDNKNQKFFFSCSYLPKYEIKDTSKYGICESFSSMGDPILLQYSFLPSQIMKARAIDQSVRRFIASIHR